MVIELISLSSICNDFHTVLAGGRNGDGSGMFHFNKSTQQPAVKERGLCID